VAQSAATGASKNRLREVFGRYFLNEDKKSRISVSPRRNASTEEYGGFVFALFPQKLASRIYETLIFEFASSLHKKPPEEDGAKSTEVCFTIICKFTIKNETSVFF